MVNRLIRLGSDEWVFEISTNGDLKAEGSREFKMYFLKSSLKKNNLKNVWKWLNFETNMKSWRKK